LVNIVHHIGQDLALTIAAEIGIGITIMIAAGMAGLQALMVTGIREGIMFLLIPT
jgi:hypothetical protein